MITIQELLYNRGLERSAVVKLVRHKYRRLDLYSLYRTDRTAFLGYQNTQKRDVFEGCDRIVSFIGENGLTARFVGVFAINGVRKENGMFIYSMEEIGGFDDLKERVIIKWRNGISWHQWIRNEMEVLEIVPGLNYKRFTDYSELILEFGELKEIVDCQYQDWKQILSAIKGVYLITDLLTGKLYVGSATGAEGIWGRWSEYVRTNGHGGNSSLKELVSADNEYAKKHFQYSILMLLPKTITAEEALQKEQLIKRKLGSNSFGLNNN